MTGPAADSGRAARRPLSWRRALAMAAPAWWAMTAAAADLTTPAAIQQELRSLGTTGTLLHVAAHPDDENTQLITYFARGRGFRTAYLSITRGDGGQNELGPDFDDKLGVLRTQELLAARKLDRGRQFFTRAIDFGYSKSPDETLAFWDRKEVLGDVVRVIRTFRPDVIVTRFPIPPGSGGHGHHTASAMLAVEAFKLAGDPHAYPEQLREGLQVWQPKRVVWNGNAFSRSGGLEQRPSIKLDIGGTDPVTGELFGAIANRSRGMHKTQGFDVFSNRAPQASVEAAFFHLEGEPATTDLFDGVDTSWNRVAGGADVARRIEALLAAFNAENPVASVPGLLELRTQMAALAQGDPVIDDKRRQLDRILQACLGLQVESEAREPEVVAGGSLRFKYRIKQASELPVKLTGIRIPFANQVLPRDDSLSRGKTIDGDVEARVAATHPLTQPYWLELEPAAGIARVSEPRNIGRPENPPALPVEYHFSVGGQTLVVDAEPRFGANDDKGDRRQAVSVVAPVAVRFPAQVAVIRPGATQPVAVEVVGVRANAKAGVRLEVAPGWTVSPAVIPVTLGKPGDKAQVTFQVTAPAAGGTARMRAHAEVDGQRFSRQRIELKYAHLPALLLQPPATGRLASFEFQKRGTRVGYLPGAGDATADALAQLGYEVVTLSGPDLNLEKLRGVDAVLIGVRAFNERSDLAANLPGLHAYVEQGGTVIAQYNRPNDLAVKTLGPYPLSIDGPAPRWRVVDETAAVTFLAPDHPLVTTPNRLGPDDFSGWVQERGAYFPSKWDEQKYTAIFAMNDPGDPVLTSSVLVARHGQGHYVYTGLAFFRQLPAGVPGAYRLFANLMSLGK